LQCVGQISTVCVELVTRQAGCSLRSPRPTRWGRETTYEDDLPDYYVPEEELRPRLEAIGRAVVERLRPHGLTAVVVGYDEEEGQTHVTSYFRKYPEDLQEIDAIWGHLSDTSGQFFDEAVLLFHVEEAHGCTSDGYSDHVLTLKAA
jgi:hypothetical protein